MPLRFAALLCVLVGTSLATSAPALAISQQGHVFAFAFGQPGKGAGQLSRPSGVGVNTATGDVYVADHRNKVVEQFKPVLTAGVLTGEEFVRELPVPLAESVAVDNSSEASDPSQGDVYVVGQTGKAIFKFNAEGELITKVNTFNGEGEKEKLEGIGGIAVTANGALLVYLTGGEVKEFNDAVVNQGETTTLTGLSREGEPGFTIDSEGNFYVGVAGEGSEAIERAKEEELVGGLPVIAKLQHTTEKVLIPQLDVEHTTAVAVDTSENSAYIDNLVNNNPSENGGEPQSTVAAFDSAGALIQRLSAPGLKEADGVAVDPATHTVYVADAASGHVYVFELEPAGKPTIEGLTACTLDPGESDCPTTTDALTLKAQIDPTGAETHYSFEYGTSSCVANPGTCTKTAPASAGSGFGDVGVSVELPGVAPGTYFYRVVAENPFGQVHSAEQTVAVAGLVSGLPDGRGWEMVSPVEKGGAEPESLTKEGGVIQAAENGRAITYVADGPMPARDAPEGSRNPEFTQVFSTRGSGTEAWASKDIVTPNRVALGINVGDAPEYQLFSPNLALSIVEPSGGNSAAGGVEPEPLAPPQSANEKAAKDKGENVQEKTIYLRDDAPLQPEASEVANYEEAVANGNLMTPHNPGYIALATEENAPGGLPFGEGEEEGLEFINANANLSHVVFASFRGPASALYEWGGAHQPLQPVSVLPDGTKVQAQLAGLGGEPSKGGSRQSPHAISSDGSLVFWTDGSNRRLYVRDTVTHESLQLDTPLPGASGAGVPAANYQFASVDGSRVFFTSEQQLTPGSRAGKTVGSFDLYVAELTGGRTLGSPVSETLTDLTPKGVNGESAKVVGNGNVGGGVVGVSEDGSHVYFVANGALTPGAPRGACAGANTPQPAGATCNLYTRELVGGVWGPPKLVAVLSSEDGSDWGSPGEQGDLGFLAARVSPNGEYLAFMSSRRLTGYDNEDVSSTPGEKRLDEEVFLYHAGDGHLVCASCNPTGARPTGVFDVGTNGSGGAGEGLGLVVDRLQIWGASRRDDHWLAGSLPGWTTLSNTRSIYQSRYLSDGGRLFFNSADALQPPGSVPDEKRTKAETVNGVEQQVGIENVYEYQPSTVGGCASGGGCVGLISSGKSEHESAFLDASASGNDVFFLTAAPLAPQDADTNFDVYDAHVCEAAAPCPPPPEAAKQPCQETQALPCKTSQTPPESFGEPGSAAASGSGNLVPGHGVLGESNTKPATKPPAKPLTRAQKLAKALKACRKDKQRSKRIACEKAAKKKYPTKKKASTKTGSQKQGSGR